MKITSKSIVSNSDMIKNYKDCRMKADTYGKIFILKNNQPDAVLFSIAEYEKLSVIIEYMEGLNEQNFTKVINSFPDEADKRIHQI